MPPFKGFPEGKVRIIPIPEQLFKELSPSIETLAELKLTLYIFWRLDWKEGAFRYLRLSEFLEDGDFMAGMGDTIVEARHALDEAIKSALQRKTILHATVPMGSGDIDLYFLNTPRGRAAVQAIAKGDWKFSEENQTDIEIVPIAPNIYQLYEENIGPLTPMIAEALQEADDTYPARWIEEAFQIAVENNARNYRYILAILNRWQIEGRDERKDRGNSEKSRRRYVEGEFADYIEY